jgi:hypothetical protein
MVAQSFEVSYMICGGASTFTQYLVRSFLSNRAVVRVVRVKDLRAAAVHMML